MGSCCRAQPCEEIFGSGTAWYDLERYLRNGLDQVERDMLAALRERVALDGTRVLEIGGGIGALQAQLLSSGAASGEVIELLDAYAPYAQELARSAGIEGRTSFRVHDLLDSPEEVDPAHVVILNRVVCCSADGPELAAQAARLTDKALLLSFPRSNRFTRALAGMQHALFRLFRRHYRLFAWPEETLIAAARSAGLAPTASGGGLIWRYLLFERP